MVDKIVHKILINIEPTVEKKLREVVSDAYAFVRSVEANRAFATVTIEQLINDQIRRNGESFESNSSRFNPYALDEDSPASEKPAARANFLGASDVGRPTKLDFLLALKNEIGDIVDRVKKIDVVDVADAEAYTDAVGVGLEEES